MDFYDVLSSCLNHSNYHIKSLRALNHKALFFFFGSQRALLREFIHKNPICLELKGKHYCRER